jgi:hypothetical protein
MKWGIFFGGLVFIEGEVSTLHFYRFRKKARHFRPEIGLF